DAGAPRRPRARASARSERRAVDRSPPGDARPRGRVSASGRRRAAAMNRRLLTLYRKELLDLMRNRVALVPVVLVALIALAMPFVIAVAVPALTHQPLGADADLVRVSRIVDAGERLPDSARVELFFFQQFLIV